MRLVGDANVLLSAVLGGRAALALQHAQIEEVFAAEAVLQEVQEYAALLASKKRLPLDLVLMAVATLPVVVVEQADYERSLSEARRRIGRRDPDDVETLALALHLNLPVWSNDNDFADAGVEWLTTAELLKQLGI